MSRLRVVSFVLLALSCAWPARADQLTIRGNYWRDRNTRVVQPEADFWKELPTGTVIGGHYLLDTITSASVASGASRDQPFTELRNEAGFVLGQRAGRALMTAAYSYSSESDYWAHLIAVSTTVDLFQHNTTLGLSMSYGLDSVAQRMDATHYNPLGGLQTFNLIATWTQVLSSKLLANFSYDLGVSGFGAEKGSLTGAPNMKTGYQGNPYRSVTVGGAPAREVVPFQRLRQSVSASGHLILPTGGRIVPYIAFRAGLRFYWDDWDVMSFTPELRTFLPIGPVELRLTGRYYTQRAAIFWNEVGGRPSYPDGHGLFCGTCVATSTREDKTGQPLLYYTSDPKLAAFDSMFLELRLLVRLDGLRRLQRLPLVNWLAAGQLELSYGHFFNNRFAHDAFGDAEVAGLSLIFPL